MPAKNTIKIYAENTIYHIYNRGVEKRKIYLDDQDYSVFLNYLKEYLSPPQIFGKKSKKSLDMQDALQGRTFKGKNYFGQIELMAYCLMPNHFHLMIKQNTNKNAIKEFVQSLLTRYSMYFNKKYNRVGTLFQGKYKAVIIINEIYLLHLSRYIHANPYEYTKDLVNAYSSYSSYLGLTHTPWLKPDLILNFFENNKNSVEFKNINTYKGFVEEYIKDNKEFLKDIKLE